MPTWKRGISSALDPNDHETSFCPMKAVQYDIVCNGIELSSGAIRNHRPE